ncbi:DinB family protein [Sphingobacterium sp. JUb56]|uniref:DinB family protein n=1 Tax=Sphingobacterium sp. JUb56 TaxID=2587145 RepID=UPI001614E353|nr:DinB family protein [Sphingobacterium sp. JUb56]MBB2951789.1 hypothetical protein [Sphingobacterium sp. JUb56]
MKILIKFMLTLGVSITLPCIMAKAADKIAVINNVTRIIEKNVPPVILNQDGNIDSLIQYFQYTTKSLKDDISGLSEAQLQFSPGEGKWSIGQCLEHIIRSESLLFEMAKKELGKAPQPNRKNEVKSTDQGLINMMTDRSQKFQAPKELQPTGKYKDSKVAIKDFLAAREPVLLYIKNANIDDLRNHISDYPTGVVDGYQNLLFIAAHCARHTKQIEEVLADPNFPKK